MTQLKGFDVAGFQNAFQSGRQAKQQRQQNAFNKQVGGRLAENDLPGARQAAFSGGNLQLGGQIDAQMKAQIASASKEQKESLKQSNEAFGGVLIGLSSIPFQERQAALQPGTGLHSYLVGQGIPAEQIAGFTPDDASIAGLRGAFGEINDIIKESAPQTVKPGEVIATRRDGVFGAEFENPKALGASGKPMVAVVDGKRVFVRPNQAGGFDVVQGATPDPKAQTGFSISTNPDGTTTVTQGSLSQQTRADAEKRQSKKQNIKLLGDFNKVNAGLADQSSATEIVLETIGKIFEGDRINNFTSGIGSLISSVPGSPAADLLADLETIRAVIGFGKLQEMRANSPTGGALGQVSNLENRLLQSVLGSLENAQSPAQLKERLTDVSRRLRDARRRRISAVDSLANTLLDQGFSPEELGLGGEQVAAGLPTQQPDQAPVRRRFNPQTGNIE